MKCSQFRCSVLLALGLVAGAALAGPSTWAPVNGVVPAVGFVVDATDRMESLSFYNGAYLASEGAAGRLQWTPTGLLMGAPNARAVLCWSKSSIDSLMTLIA